ncbi:Unknown protein [Striga hermonthica]|uniref:Replication factor A C-terminal domain-containing protein n=1 Tax=Striga hermonthica TaxID=68872 RepID=A0A9N7RCI1_STRHE|nr:Unknown protein [Striga hermonthica]
MPSILNRDIEPLVVILQFCRAKVVGASVKVSNTFDITKLIVDQSADEIKEFVAAYGGCAEIANSIREVNAPLVITDNVETENNFEFSVKTIDDYLYTCGQVGSYWICALIESFTGDYWYQSCRKCPKKLTSAGKRFYCEKCDDFFDDGVLKYKVQFEVSDATGNTSFICWNKDCEKLLGYSCHELRSKYTKMQDGIDIPDELAAMIGKKILFKVQVKSTQIKNFDGSFSVFKTCDDAEAVGKYGTFLIEKSDLMSKLVRAEAEKELDYGVDENDEDNKYEDEDEVNSPDKDLFDKKNAADETPLKYYCKRKLFGESSSTTQKKGKLHDAEKSDERDNEVEEKTVEGENEVVDEENADMEDV